MLKSNNFQHYKLSTFYFLNIKIPSFSFLKKAILGLHKNLFWHISRKIGKILENFQKVPFKALLKQQKIFSKSLMKMDRFPKKIFFIEKSNCHNFWRFMSYIKTLSVPASGRPTQPQHPQIFFKNFVLSGKTTKFVFPSRFWCHSNHLSQKNCLGTKNVSYNHICRAHFPDEKMYDM